MEKLKRYAASQILHHSGAIMYGVTHELWRIANGPDYGLTDKEKAYLNKRLVAIKAEMIGVSKVQRRLQHG